jgi:hypothetical protein
MTLLKLIQICSVVVFNDHDSIYLPTTKLQGNIVNFISKTQRKPQQL